MSDTVYVGYSCRPCITLHHLIIIMTGISCHTHNIQQYCSSLTHKTSQNTSTCIMSNFCCIGYEISFVVGVMNTKGSKRYSCISNFFSTCMCNLGFNSIQKISAVPWAFIYLASSHAKLFFMEQLQCLCLQHQTLNSISLNLILYTSQFVPMKWFFVGVGVILLFIAWDIRVF